MLLVRSKRTHQFQYCDFHHTLIEVGRFVFDDFHCHDLVRLHILTFDNLAKRPLTQNVKNEISSQKVLVVIDMRNEITYLCPSSAPSQSLTYRM